MMRALGYALIVKYYCNYNYIYFAIRTNIGDPDIVQHENVAVTRLRRESTVLAPLHDTYFYVKNTVRLSLHGALVQHIDCVPSWVQS